MKPALGRVPCWAAIVTLLSCGGSVLPVPPIGPHMNEEAVLVPYPPPAARVEIVPPKPPELDGDAVWVDGEWQWKGRRWIWQGGQWQIPVEGGYWAPATTVRLPDGKLAYFAGTWKSKEGAEAAKP